MHKNTTFIPMKLSLAVIVMVLMLESGLISCKKDNRIPIEDQLYIELDHQIPAILKSQVIDSIDSLYGSIPDASGIHHPASCAGFIQTLMAVYANKASIYFSDDLLYNRMNAAMDYLLLCQHEDGTIDNLATNFHSTPDLAFAVEPLSIAYILLFNPEIIADNRILLAEKIQRFLLKAGTALKTGGIHTPNHRWVVSLALARIHSLFPDSTYLSRINQWSRESIDQDLYGQYYERSTGTYDPLTNRWLIDLADIIHNDSLLTIVKKNLDHTLYMFHPDGSAVTDISRRQDKGTYKSLSAYYAPYVLMANKTGDGRYWNIAANIIKTNHLGSLTGIIPYTLFNPNLKLDSSVMPTPLNYDTLFSELGIARQRKDDQDATILSQNPTFFSFQKKDVFIKSIRLASAFFGKGQFVSDTIIKTDLGYELNQNLRGPYYQPLDRTVSIKEDWERLKDPDTGHRAQSEVQTYHAKILINKAEDGYRLSFDISGTDHVPFAIEIALDQGITIEGSQYDDANPDIHFFKSNEIVLRKNNQVLKLHGNIPLHRWTQIRGGLAKMDGKCIYLTGYSNWKGELKLE